MAIVDDHPKSASSAEPSSGPTGGSLRRFFSRIFRRSKRATTFGGMTYDEFGKFTAENPPPQKWHEQDVQGLRGSDR